MDGELESQTRALSVMVYLFDTDLIKCRVGWFTKVSIAGVDYDVAAGPSLDPCYITAMVQEDSKSPIVLLDIELESLGKATVDRNQATLVIQASDGGSAVSLDFWRMIVPVQITFKDSFTLMEAIKLLPKRLTEVDETQVFSQELGESYSMAGPLVIPDNCQNRQNVRGDDTIKDENHPAESEGSQAYSTQNCSNLDCQEASSELSSVSSQTTPPSINGLNAKSTSASRTTSTKVYRAKNGRYVSKNTAGAKPPPKSRTARGRTSNSTVSDTNTRCRPRSQSPEIGFDDVNKQSQRINFDSPPPISPPRRQRSRLQNSQETEGHPRKRGKNDSDDDFQPSRKRTCTVKATLKGIPKTTSSKVGKREPSQKRLTFRRQSAPSNRSKYGPQGNIESIEDTEHDERGNPSEGISRNTNLRTSNVKSTLTLLVNSKGIEDPQTNVQKRPKSLRTDTVVDTSSEEVDAEEAPEPKESLAGESSMGLSEPFTHFPDPAFCDDVNEAISRQSIHAGQRTRLTDSSKQLPKLKEFGKDPTQAQTANSTSRNTIKESCINGTSLRSITVPGQGTPHPNNPRDTFKKRADALDALPEEVLFSAKEAQPVKDFQLLRANLDNEAEDQSASNGTPSPSPIKVRSGPIVTSSQRKTRLLLRDGKIQSEEANAPSNLTRKAERSAIQGQKKRTVTGNMTKNHIVAEPSSLSIPSGDELRSILLSAAKQATSNHPPSQTQQIQQDQRPNPPQIVGAIHMFHTKLAEKGIAFANIDISEDVSSNDPYSSDSDLSDEESGEDMDVVGIERQPELPAHQKTVRDALAEITEVTTIWQS